MADYKSGYTGAQIDAAVAAATAALPKSGGTMTGALTLKGAPTSNLHAATKKYVDDSVNNIALTPGEKGDPGENGVSCTHSWDGTTLTVTSASGTSSANLKGEKGDKGDPGDASSVDAVLYTAQELTPEQQAQARANIGATDLNEVGEHFGLGGLNPNLVENRACTYGGIDGNGLISSVFTWYGSGQICIGTTRKSDESGNYEDALPVLTGEAYVLTYKCPIGKTPYWDLCEVYRGAPRWNSITLSESAVLKGVESGYNVYEYVYTPPVSVDGIIIAGSTYLFDSNISKEDAIAIAEENAAAFFSVRLADPVNGKSVLYVPQNLSERAKEYARANIGATSGDWVKLAEVTTTEEVNGIHITSDMDNQRFICRRIVGYLRLPSALTGDASVAIAAYDERFGEEPIWFFNGTNDALYQGYDIERVGNGLFKFHIAQSTEAHFWSKSTLGMTLRISQNNRTSTSQIRAFRISRGDSNKTYPIGTKLEVWGIKV